MASSTLASSAIRSSRRTFRSLLRIPSIRVAILSAVIYTALPLISEYLLTELQPSTIAPISPAFGLGLLYSIFSLTSCAGATLLPLFPLLTPSGRRDFRLIAIALGAPILVACLFPTRYAAILDILQSYGF